MESTPSAHEQLESVERLQRSVWASAQYPRRVWVALAIATVLFFGTYDLGVPWLDVAAPVAWCAFVLWWVRWLHHLAGVRPRWRSLPEVRRWRVRVGWLASLVVMGAIVWVPGVPFVFKGVAIACVSLWGGRVLYGRPVIGPPRP